VGSLPLLFLRPPLAVGFAAPAADRSHARRSTPQAGDYFVADALWCSSYSFFLGEWDSDTSAYASYGGHLGVLQWARENGCKWDTRTCWGAAEGGHLGVLQWARANGCPWDREECCVRTYRSSEHEAIRAWINSLPQRQG